MLHSIFKNLSSDIYRVVMFSFVVTLCLIFFSCGDQSVQTEKELIGLLNNYDGILYVAPEYGEVVASALGVSHVSDSIYRFIENDTHFDFVMESSNSLQLELDEYLIDANQMVMDSSLDNSMNPLFGTSGRTVFNNAKCGKVIARKESKCKRTFGRHQACGTHMIRIRGSYKVCTKGTAVCVERLQRVGYFFYANNADCEIFDTLMWDTPINRFACP